MNCLKNTSCSLSLGIFYTDSDTMLNFLHWISF